MPIFRPVILNDKNKIDELENGDVAFDTVDKKIFLKMDDQVDLYGGLNTTEINEIVNQVILEKELEMRWNVIDSNSNVDPVNPDPVDPDPPIPTDDPVVTITAPTNITRGIEATFTFTTENIPDIEQITFTAYSGIILFDNVDGVPLDAHDANVIPLTVDVNYNDNNFKVIPAKSGENALTIYAKILDYKFATQYNVISNPTISIGIPQPPQSTVVNQPCEIKFSTTYHDDSINNNNVGTISYLNENEVTITITINDDNNLQTYTVDTYSNNPTANRYSTITVTPNTVGTMTVSIVGTRNTATHTKIITIDVTPAE